MLRWCERGQEPPDGSSHPTPPAAQRQDGGWERELLVHSRCLVRAASLSLLFPKTRCPAGLALTWVTLSS